MQQGYIQNFIDENAIVVSMELKLCYPKRLTTIEAESNYSHPKK